MVLSKLVQSRGARQTNVGVESDLRSWLISGEWRRPWSRSDRSRVERTVMEGKGRGGERWRTLCLCFPPEPSGITTRAGLRSRCSAYASKGRDSSISKTDGFGRWNADLIGWLHVYGLAQGLWMSTAPVEGCCAEGRDLVGLQPPPMTGLGFARVAEQNIRATPVSQLRTATRCIGTEVMSTVGGDESHDDVLAVETPAGSTTGASRTGGTGRTMGASLQPA